VVSDITERRRAQERQTLLAREVDHRAKNALAVVQAAMRLTRAENQGDYIRAVEGRVAALARAQSLLAQQGWGGADLRSLAEGELAPFLSGLGARGGGPKIRCCGHPLVIAPQAVQPLSMILHELATNAVKHGALSTPQGRLAIVWRQEPGSGDLRLRWAERGGPAIAAPPTRQGFGSRLVEQTTANQLGGTVERRWHAAGLVCELLLPADRVLAGG
jgi:two-component sensor histidine kinase